MHGVNFILVLWIGRRNAFNLVLLKNVVLCFYYLKIVGMGYCYKWILSVGLFLSCLTIAFTQSFGVPFIYNYSPLDYGAGAQNWAIVQAQNGLVYFGNNDGVLEYDGVTWRLIETKRNTVVRSLAVDQNDAVFVGAYGEIGYLTPDSLGTMAYVSLLPYVDSNYLDFADVWQTCVTGNAVYFSTQKYLFKWESGTMKTWVTPTYNLHMAIVDDEIYVRQWQSGLMKMVSDSLVLLPGGEQFNLPIIASILPYADRSKAELLICTQTDGLFLYDGLRAMPFHTDFDDILSEARIYQGSRLFNGHYAFATILGGVFIMDQGGHLIQHIIKETGLQNNTVWSIYPDQQNGLWIALDAGISRAEVSGPLTHLGNKQGLEGTVLDILRHQNQLYMATSRGVYLLDESESHLSTFTPIKGLPPQCFDLLSFGDVLLVATLQGVYEIQAGKIREITKSYSFSLTRSIQDSNRVFVGLQIGLMSIYKSKGQWKEEGSIGVFDLEVRELLETEDGNLWASTGHQGIMKIDYTSGFTKQPVITHFDTSQGLPIGDYVAAANTHKGPRFLTSGGIYIFDSSTKQFHPDSLLVPNLPIQQAAMKLATSDIAGNLWLLPARDIRPGVARLKGQSYSWDDTPLLRVRTQDITMLYPDPLDPGIVWFGGTERVLRYDDSVSMNYQQEFKTLIRRVTINNDTIIYNGNSSLPSGDYLKLPELSYGQNSLRVSFAALSYDGVAENMYQYYLEGYDGGWSTWSKESWKDYTNLREGDYRFKVRGKNIYQHVVESATMEFTVRPPWYRSWLAYLSYGFILMCILYLIRRREIKRISHTHQQEVEHLEFNKLKELDKLKSRFFTDVSHEFRTPLSLILGPMDNLLAKHPDGENVREFQMVRRNAQRLLRMINQMLDLSRLEADKMHLDLANENLLPLIKGIISSFELLAENKGISLTFETHVNQAWMNFDQDKMEQIFTNLIANALKFTPQGGTVSVHVNSVDDNKWLRIDVRDTGSGISEDELPHVFNRFYQAKDTPNRSSVGSGIGLALCKEMTELHGGQIRVTSTLGHGTQFQVELPLSVGQPLSIDLKEPKIDFENTILVVDDNSDMRVFICEALKGSYHIIEAEDGQQALDMALEHVPDLILSDVMMPKMDGLELCAAVKKDDRINHIPLILLTAKSSVSSRIEGLDQGADDYLGKPFRYDELSLRIHNLFEWRKTLQKKYSDPNSSTDIADNSADIQFEFLEKTRETVRVHLKDEDMNIEGFAQSLNMSRSQFFRKIKSLTGQSPSLFIRNIRLDVGKGLLESTQMNVTEVAYEVGFSTPTYFSDAFKDQYGMRPSQIRK